MNAITYNNTVTTIPRWTEPIHLKHPRGFAYETDTHFVHMYGDIVRFHPIHVGLTVTEKKTGTLVDWVLKTFGAVDIKALELEVGQSIEGVWRPSLYYYTDVLQALNCSDVDMRLAEQSLRILINKLDELFLYIEPESQCLQTYSHKTRELLILACTEVENSWKSYMTKSSTLPVNGRTYTTQDYVKLLDKLYLDEYQFKLILYQHIPPIVPFKGWDKNAPSVSLTWYDAYNKTKHDRTTNFSVATLWNCISAVVANLVMHSVKFGPYPMFERTSVFSTLVQEHFQGELIDSSPISYYLHEFVFPHDARNDLFIWDPRDYRLAKPFTVLPLIL